MDFIYAETLCFFSHASDISNVRGYLGKYVGRLRGGDKTIEILPCPTCRSEFTLKSNQDVADLTSIHFIINMLKITAIQNKAKVSAKCSRCQDPAINHCATCEIFMCKNCSEFHDSWSVLKKHNVLSVEELSNPESQAKIRRKLYCLNHKEKLLEYYCETCKELCCIDCVVLNHTKRNHSCLVMCEVAHKEREKLQSNFTTLDEKLSEGKKALNKICEVMNCLEKNAKSAKDQVNEQKEKILKIVAEKLDEKAKKMREEVDEFYGKMRSELSKQHDEMKEYLDKVEASLSLPRNLLKRGSIEEILSSQILIDEKIEKLENEKPEDLDAVNDGDIQYVPDDNGNINVDEVISKLGHVEGMYCFFVSVVCGREELLIKYLMFHSDTAKTMLGTLQVGITNE